MKKSPVFSLILAIAIIFSAFSAHAVEQNSPAVTAGCRTIHARLPLGGSDQLTETADAVLLYELNTDTLVYGWNIDDIIDPTGMVKILTVLVALENGNLDDAVTVKRSTLDTVAIGAVSANLKSNEVVTLRDLLYCIMVSSANDAAAVVAEHIAGSQTAFVIMMNAKAQELGCTNSCFYNVHGLAGTEQYSTARDLAIITEAALENELFCQMFATDNYTVPATNKSDERYIITTNYMMSDEYIKTYLDERVTGGKTAAASLTDRSLICTAEAGTSRYLCVVMGADATVTEDGFTVITFGSFEEAAAALNYGFRNFAVRQVADTGQTFAQYAVAGGANDVALKVTEDLYAVLPVDFSIDDLNFNTVVDAGLLSAPISVGDILGTLQVSYHNIVLGTCQLQAMHSVAPIGSVIQDSSYLEAALPEPVDYAGILIKVGIVLAAILLLAALILLVIRIVRNARIRRQHRRRMRNRRRSR